MKIEEVLQETYKRGWQDCANAVADAAEADGKLTVSTALLRLVAVQPEAHTQTTTKPLVLQQPSTIN